MTQLYETEFLECPYRRARQYLADALCEASESGAAKTLCLRLPVAGGAAGGLEKDVRVHYGRSEDPMHFDQPWSIRWEATGGGLFPTFAGELTVRAEDRYETCTLELRGAYEPPLGIAGRAFDATIGSYVAGATARELLHDIGARMVARYVAEEAAKAARS